MSTKPPKPRLLGDGESSVCTVTIDKALITRARKAHAVACCGLCSDQAPCLAKFAQRMADTALAAAVVAATPARSLDAMAHEQHGARATWHVYWVEGASQRVRPQTFSPEAFGYTVEHGRRFRVSIEELPRHPILRPRPNPALPKAEPPPVATPAAPKRPRGRPKRPPRP